jgi:hypothetical protein
VIILRKIPDIVVSALPTPQVSRSIAAIRIFVLGSQKKQEKRQLLG